MAQIRKLIINIILWLNFINLSKSQQNSKQNSYQVNKIKCPNNRFPENCYEIQKCLSNVYAIKITEYSNKSFNAVCDLQTAKGGWTVIQRRINGSENFFRTWDDYVKGFGKMNGEFFIGLEKLHHLTTQGRPQVLYIIMEDFQGVRKYARYQTFRVDSESSQYKLRVGGYSGNAGDSFSKHNGYTFSTRDRGKSTYCAMQYKAGWWYHRCHESNLNGLDLNGKYSKSKHGQGIVWSSFRGYDYSLKFVQMMIRPKY